jgi:hypothetical protein
MVEVMRQGRGVTFIKGRVYSLRKRMAVARSEEGGVEVDDGGALQGSRGRGRRWRCDNDQEWCINGLRKRTVPARSEARVEVAAYSRAGGEAAV